MDGITVAQALKHPSWRMGRKVTIDSATLMNKGLEVIEARWLFNMPIDSVTVLVHPRSIIHSMVEFADGSVKAQLSCPDMRLPIQYALCYPDRPENPELPRLDWDKIRELTFEPPDMDKFPCLRLAIEAGREGGTCPAVLCDADETAVDLFLAGRLKFTDIPRLVALALEKHKKVNHPSIEEIIGAEKWGRDMILDIIRGEGK
jgi:1-deoxy-D-xylulose-5-phosphate reductoisomerase